MKKLLIGILCLLTVTFTAFGLIGCNKNNGASTTESTSVESTSTSQSEKESSSESNVESNSNGCAHTLDVLKKKIKQLQVKAKIKERFVNLLEKIKSPFSKAKDKAIALWRKIFPKKSAEANNPGSEE